MKAIEHIGQYFAVVLFIMLYKVKFRMRVRVSQGWFYLLSLGSNPIT